VSAATFPVKATNTRIIARNSIWFGVETGFLFLTTLVTSIAMARAIGPQRLGYFNYIMWLANISGVLGSLGVPAATSKYMAEYLGRGEHGIARAIFGATMRLQGAMACAVTCVGIGLILTVGDPQHRLVSAIQVASMLPAMLTFVPAQANAARENLRANAVASIVGTTLFAISIILSLVLGWDLLGIATGILIYRSVELLIRLIPVWRWVNSLPKTTLPDEVKRRMFKFSANSIILMILNIVVWDRSDVILLKTLSSDISQITFFTVAFNLVEKALILPGMFAAGVTVTVNAQYGRDKTKLNAIISSSARYLVLLSAPVLLGLAAISSPAMRLAYGRQYIAAIPVLTLAAIMALPKPLNPPAQQMLQANEQQRFLIVWGICCGIANITIDWLLIPRFGALGAAIGNGTAQMLGVAGPWFVVKRRFDLHLDYRGIVRVFGSALVMSAVVMGLQHFISGLPAVLIGIPLGGVVFALSLKYMRAIKEEDISRLLQLERSVPACLHPTFNWALRWIAPDALHAATE
jgi:O-antigen/teichoic acid export membrane protein